MAAAQVTTSVGTFPQDCPWQESKPWGSVLRVICVYNHWPGHHMMMIMIEPEQWQSYTGNLAEPRLWQVVGLLTPRLWLRRSMTLLVAIICDRGPGSVCAHWHSGCGTWHS